MKHCTKCVTKFKDIINNRGNYGLHNRRRK